VANRGILPRLVQVYQQQLNKSIVLKIPKGCSSISGRAFLLPQGERDGGW